VGLRCLVAVDEPDAHAPPVSPRSEAEWLRKSWERLAALAGELDLEPREKQLLQLRWIDEASHYDKLWRRQRRIHDAFGVLTIVSGLAAPVLVAFDAPEWTLAVAGFTVAVSSALVGFFRYGERWQHQRRTAMLLKSEGIRFLELRSPYAGYGSHRTAFPHFLDHLEELNEAQSEEYLALWRLPPPPSGEGPARGGGA
jgi:Protein of unknown function (DUF4231)